LSSAALVIDATPTMTSPANQARPTPAEWTPPQSDDESFRSLDTDPSDDSDSGEPTGLKSPESPPYEPVVAVAAFEGSKPALSPQTMRSEPIISFDGKVIPWDNIINPPKAGDNSDASDATKPHNP
jgi:hypothetical protein